MVIGKEFEFHAAHQLPFKEIYGNCCKLHGHTYKLIVELEGHIDGNGWVLGFTELKQIVKETVIDKYDHSNLNDLFPVPTAEIIAEKIFKDIRLRMNDLNKPIYLHSVTLYETPTSYAKITRK